VLTFQRLDVYQRAIQFYSLALRIAVGVPRGHAAALDQFRRAALSVPLNIAEAAGRTGLADAARTYAIARGSAMECAAILDTLEVSGVVSERDRTDGIALLERIVAMLTRLCRKDQ
jgi:four helix bundle protein